MTTPYRKGAQQSDPDLPRPKLAIEEATGEQLDRIAAVFGIKRRAKNETDTSFRCRIIRKLYIHAVR